VKKEMSIRGRSKMQLKAKLTSLAVTIAMVLNLGLPSAAFGQLSPTSSLSQSQSPTQIQAPISVPYPTSTSTSTPAPTQPQTQTQTQTFQVVISMTSGTDVNKVAQDLGAKVIRKGPLNFATLEFMTTQTISQVIGKLKLTPGIINAEENQRRTLLATTSASTTLAATAPEDPHFKDQWSMVSSNVQGAWDLGATGQGITIAVIDTGVALDHPDLKDNLVPGYNAITGSEAQGANQDDNGHGTHVSGIAAAERNGLGIVGVAYQAKIMPIKVADSKGEAYDDTIADGIVWAVDHGAKIINLSLGSNNGSGPMDVFRQAIAYAYNKGCLLVAAAGNYDPDKERNPGVSYPASDPHVLAISATDEYGDVASYSETGPEVALAAPGDIIYSDWWDRVDGLGYTYDSGTSMAAPFVAGEAALIWGQHPSWSRDQVIQALEVGADDLGNTGRDNQYGYGLANVGLAVALANQTSQTSNVFTSPAAVNQLGGIVQATESSTRTSLTIPANAFYTSSNVSVQTTSAPADLPNGASFLTPVFQVGWGNAAPQNMLTLTLDNPSLNSASGGEIYHWDGSRWIALGGEIVNGEAQLGLYTGGIYAVGTPQITTESSRFAGTTAVETAIKISQATFATGADTVILAQANQFPDALAGAPLAYKLQAPILLSPNSGLTDEIRAELTRLSPKTIYLLGGTAALSSTIESELKQNYDVKRLAGYTAEGTAAAIAQELGTKGKAVVASGRYFQDALVISSWAARQGIPILLTEPSTLAKETNTALRNLNVTQTLVIGGTAVVGANIMNNLPFPQRISGMTAYDTETAVLNLYPPASSKLEVATGENYPDALTGAVRAAFYGSMVVLVPTHSTTPSSLTDLLKSWQGKQVEGLGGVLALPEDVVRNVESWVQ
jgi:Subtilisin-like serine proteases